MRDMPAVRVDGRIERKSVRLPQTLTTASQTNARAGRLWAFHVRYVDAVRKTDGPEYSVRDIDVQGDRSGLSSNDGVMFKPHAGPLGQPRQCRWRPGRRLLYPNGSYRASKHLKPVLKAQRGDSGPAHRAPGYRPGWWPRPPPPRAR